MPHIRMTFFEDPVIRDALKTHLNKMETLVASEFGYPKENVKFIPEPISPQDQEIASHIDGLIFSITAGSRVLPKAQEHCDALRRTFAALPKLQPIPFVVLLKPQQGMVMSSHNPT